MTTHTELTILYDGACPLCRREIAFYRGCRGAEDIRWVDVSHSTEGEIVPGLTTERALARFHVRTAEGELLSGGRAFIRLWTALPGFRPLGAILRPRVVVWLVDRAYDLFLKLRPLLRVFVRDAIPGEPALRPDRFDCGQRWDHAGVGRQCSPSAGDARGAARHL